MSRSPLPQASGLAVADAAGGAARAAEAAQRTVGWRTVLGVFKLRIGVLIEEFFAVSVERRITHPCVVAITHAARGELFSA